MTYLLGELNGVVQNQIHEGIKAAEGAFNLKKKFFFSIVFLLRLLFFNSANLTPAIDPEVNPLVHELFELWGMCLRHLGMLDKEL